MIIHDVQQGSDAWKQLRLGKVTASRMADLMAKTKTGWGQSRANYLADLVTERLTGQPTEGYTNAAMAWGTEQEPHARSLYSLTYDVDVQTIGIVQHKEISDFLASPDGLVCEGLIEIKSPQSNTHIEYLLEQKVPQKYVLQMQSQMACTGRPWCDFVSFDPRMPSEMQLFVKRIERDDKLIKEIEDLVKTFITELDETVLRLRQLYKPGANDNGKFRTNLRSAGIGTSPSSCEIAISS